MHWSVCVLYEHGIPVEVRWRDGGFDHSSLCLPSDEPTANFTYTHSEIIAIRCPATSDSYAPAAWPV
jgi:hypothetical protein